MQNCWTEFVDWIDFTFSMCGHNASLDWGGHVVPKVIHPKYSQTCDKEQFDKEQIGVMEPFPVTNCQFTS
jgi:hypothetical protein